jgi:hypothetical protein
MLHAPKALLFCRRHDVTLANQASGRIAVICINAEDIHAASLAILSV